MFVVFIMHNFVPGIKRERRVLVICLSWSETGARGQGPGQRVTGSDQVDPGDSHLFVMAVKK